MMPISLVERLTDQQLQILSEQWGPAAVEILALRARIAKLEAQNKALRARLEELDNEAAGYGLWTLGA